MNTIETERLKMGNISNKDVPKIIEYAGNKKVAERTLEIPHPYLKEHALFWINSIKEGLETKTKYTFGLRLKNSTELMGAMGLILNTKFNRATLGYWVAEPFWNKGYATEAAQAIIKFGFDELQLNKIYATHVMENPASGKVMMKCGMIKEGELKDHAKRDNKYFSLLQYRLTHNEYKNLVSKKSL
jgi:ribosomal-protein-alanine N-acetyltransferase